MHYYLIVVSDYAYNENLNCMIFELEKEQQLAFNRLKKAYADCEKTKVLLVNQYGTLHAYNGKVVIGFGDDVITPKGNPIYYYVFKEKVADNIIRNVDSGRADDENEWMVGLTDKGLKLFNEDDEDDL